MLGVIADLSWDEVAEEHARLRLWVRHVVSHRPDGRPRLGAVVLVIRARGDDPSPLKSSDVGFYEGIRASAQDYLMGFSPCSD